MPRTIANGRLHGAGSPEQGAKSKGLSAKGKPFELRFLNYVSPVSERAKRRMIMAIANIFGLSGKNSIRPTRRFEQLKRLERFELVR